MFDTRKIARCFVSFILAGAIAGCAAETAPAPAPDAGAQIEGSILAVQSCPAGGFDITQQACLCKLVYADCQKTCYPMPAGPTKTSCYAGCEKRYYNCLPG